jgi:hypothetical protein
MNQFSRPGDRGLSSVRVLLAQLPQGWQKRKDARPEALIPRAIEEMSAWLDSDTAEPIARLQRGVALAVLALERSLAGASPPATLMPAGPDDLPEPHPNSHSKRRYRTLAPAERVSA